MRCTVEEIDVPVKGRIDLGRNALKLHRYNYNSRVLGRRPERWRHQLFLLCSTPACISDAVYPERLQASRRAGEHTYLRYAYRALSHNFNMRLFAGIARDNCP